MLYEVRNKRSEAQTNEVVFEILIEKWALTCWHNALVYLLLIPQKWRINLRRCRNYTQKEDPILLAERGWKSGWKAGWMCQPQKQWDTIIKNSGFKTQGNHAEIPFSLTRKQRLRVHSTAKCTPVTGAIFSKFPPKPCAICLYCSEKRFVSLFPFY